VKKRRHTPDQVVRKLREADRLLADVTDHVQRLVFIVVIFLGVSASGFYILELGLWPTVAASGFLVLVCFFEGAYKLWAEAEDLALAQSKRRLRLADPYLSPARSGKTFSRWRFGIDRVNEGIMLSWRTWLDKAIPASASCEVEDPYGQRHVGKLERSEEGLRCIFPRDFDCEEASGRYFVHWKADEPYGGMEDPIPFTLVEDDT
jgi:hypothetical protein